MGQILEMRAREVWHNPEKTHSRHRHQFRYWDCVYQERSINTHNEEIICAGVESIGDMGNADVQIVLADAVAIFQSR